MYDHTAFTAWLDAAGIERGKMKSRRDATGAFLGYLFDPAIMDAIKRGTIEAYMRFKEPYLLHLTIFMDEANDISGFFNALGTACQRDLGYRPLYAAAIERKRQEEIEREYKFRPDGFHYQCPLWVEYTDTVKMDLRKIIRRQRGRTVLNNPRATHISGGHLLNTSINNLYMGLKHIGGYVGKIHPTKPKSQEELNKWIKKAGITKKLKRLVTSQFHQWDTLNLHFNNQHIALTH